LFLSFGFSVFDEVEMRALDTDDVAQNWPAGEVRGYPYDAIT